MDAMVPPLPMARIARTSPWATLNHGRDESLLLHNQSPHEDSEWGSFLLNPLRRIYDMTTRYGLENANGYVVSGSSRICCM